MKMMMMELLLDADGAACCRLRLPDHLPHAGSTYIPSKKSLGANLISHLLLLLPSRVLFFSLIIFLTLLSATKYITLNMYVYITG